MPCYKPLDAYHAPGGISFNRSESFGTPVSLPCGQCIGCRLEKAKEWALRCHHESIMHRDNSFVTLTYDDHHIPDHRNLHYPHFQKFLRKLRKKLKKPVRFYMCGEYGDRCEKHSINSCPECGPIQRPHYHAILFGVRFEDSYLWAVREGNRVYRSPTLEKLWEHGNSEIGSVTFQSAGYVARYIIKKQNGERAQIYDVADQETGEIITRRVAPFTRMSLKPGIGKSWYDKHKSDLWPHDFAVLPDGRETSVPRYYRELLEKENPALAAQLRAKRVEKSENNPHNTPERLAVREFVKTKKAERLKRKL